MGFAVWVDEEHQMVWAQGTHEYRPMGVAVIAASDQFRQRDFQPRLRRPIQLQKCFAGFFGSLETLNESLRTASKPRLRETPAHLL